ncbi:hypothetical protein [Methylobacterium sp. 37f]|uniref:hypothetical protein n=1 Tax=Methylobacterium sp. 37f TaxID=2817058 RepID=UPI001FFD3DE0|nr:hypothetical protein [Methylobacterium sp. 37f]MCK2056111.1 hypothetical protein [Methylobacterium sp. 37f]
MQFDLTSEEACSFAMGFFRFSLIEVPMRLVRFSHSAAGEAGRLGRFWMHASDIAALLAQPGTGRDLIGRVSDRWAICDDWGDKAVLWTLTIPPVARILAAIGKAHFQPTISPKTLEQQRDRNAWNALSCPVYWLPTGGASYAGGGLQYIVPVRTTDGALNRGIDALIGPPLSTDKVATNLGLFLGT